MQDQFMKQAEEFFSQASRFQMPNGVQDIAQDNLAKTHQAVKQMTKATAKTQKELEGVVETYAKGAKSLNKKVFDTVSSNAAASLEAAEAVASSKSVNEAARVQADFMQKQMAEASEQTREFVELGQKLAQQTFEKWQVAATKSFETFQPK